MLKIGIFIMSPIPGKYAIGIDVCGVVWIFVKKPLKKYHIRRRGTRNKSDTFIDCHIIFD